MNSAALPQLRFLFSLWLGGLLALAVATLACFQLDLGLTTTAFMFLIIVVFFSLMDSLISSVVLSAIAIGLLNFFFTEPIFSFRVDYRRDIAALIAFVVTSIVITELVRRVRKLADSQREQARLLDLTHDCVIVRDMSDVITYWNQGAEELYGWNRPETVGKVTHALLQTIFPVPLREITEMLTRDGRWEGELIHTKRDKTQVTVASRWALQRDGSGKPVGVLETNNDITQRKRGEELLNRSQAAYLAEAQKLSRTGSFGWNTSSGDIFWSEESFRIFGYDPAVKPSIELILQRVHPNDVARVQRAFNRALNDRNNFDIQHRLLMPDGSIKYLHMVGHFITDGPSAVQFVGAVMDVTFAREAEERLHQAHSELAYVSRVTTLGELAASIAHEINQPLAAIGTNGEACLRWLDRDVPQVEEAVDSVRQIIADNARAGDIVQRIRTLVKKGDDQRAQLNLNDVIEGVVPLIHRELVNHGVSLHLELFPELPLVLADHVQLQQVVINLAINSIQAMASVTDQPRELVIRSQRSGPDRVLVSVKDTGTGISPDIACKLFGAFFTTKQNGMGMGLAICRSIIEAHGGSIWAGATAGEMGAMFQFALPSMLAAE